MENKFIKEKITQLEARVANLEAILAEKIKPVKPRKKKSEDEKISLDKFKRTFWNSIPQDRTDPFTDKELVLWASYLLANTSRREILNSWAEIGKREKRIKKIIEYYVEQYVLENGHKDVDYIEQDKYARLKTKEFLQYMLWEAPPMLSKTGPQPITFYIATSPWAINTYGVKVKAYSFENHLETLMTPFPPEDE